MQHHKFSSYSDSRFSKGVNQPCSHFHYTPLLHAHAIPPSHIRRWNKGRKLKNEKINHRVHFPETELTGVFRYNPIWCMIFYQSIIFRRARQPCRRSSRCCFNLGFVSIRWNFHFCRVFIIAKIGKLFDLSLFAGVKSGKIKCCFPPMRKLYQGERFLDGNYKFALQAKLCLIVSSRSQPMMISQPLAN